LWRVTAAGFLITPSRRDESSTDGWATGTILPGEFYPNLRHHPSHWWNRILVFVMQATHLQEKWSREMLAQTTKPQAKQVMEMPFGRGF
jgi:hypothetical protein